MKSKWLMWVVGLLGGATPAADRTDPQPAETTSRATRLTAPAPVEKPSSGPQSASSLKPADPFAPFAIDDLGSVPPQPDLFRNGMQSSGESSGPINTEEPDRDFFTDPRFDDGRNSGRLFYHQTFLRNPHDPHLPERRVWHLCWSPLNDGTRAQRLPERPGMVISEVTTDGQTVQVHHLALAGNATQVDTLRWVGDALGHGRFEPNPPLPPMAIPAEPTAFERERDRGYTLLSDRRPSEAAEAFEKALALRADDPASLFALGVAWEGVARTKPDPATRRALEAYARALAADPSRTSAYERRAELFVRLNQLPQAVADLSSLIKVVPDGWEARLQRAALQAKLKEPLKAIADAEEAARVAPTESAPLEQLALYQYQAGKFEAAIATGNRLLALDDSRTAIRVTMAVAFVRLDRSAEALKTYRDAQANGVTNPERQWGLRELVRWAGRDGTESPRNRGAQRLREQLRGPDELEPLEEDAP